MATVEVVRGVAQAQNRMHVTPVTSPKKKRRTLSLSFSFKFFGNKGKGKESSTPAHLLDAMPLPVAFTAHLPPPTYVPSSHVLVQIFAVGLDALDSLMVQDKVASGSGVGTGRGGKAAGHIPGRSLVGRVVECGWEVKSDVCKKGEWIIGLLDVRKSGALTEYITLDRHRLCRAPQPRSRPTSLFPSTNRRSHIRSMSLPSHLHSLPSHAMLNVPSLNPLTAEELALLPLCGFLAHRAVRTFSDIITPSKSQGSSDAQVDQEKVPRILILHGHDGPGAMAAQMLSHRGVKITVQVPESAVRAFQLDEDDVNALSEDDAPSTVRRVSSKLRLRKRSPFDELEARLHAWGASEVLLGQSIQILQQLVSEGRSFDGILDTVGGTDIWEASRKLLLADPLFDITLAPGIAPSPSTSELPNSKKPKAGSVSNGNKARQSPVHTQFTTLVGDNPDRPIPTAQDNLRSGFRSMKRRTSTSDSGSVKFSLPISPSKVSLGSTLSRSNSIKTVSSVTGQHPHKSAKRSVAYAWVSVTADVDFEGEDVRDSLSAVVGMVEEGWIRPWVGEMDGIDHRVVPFDKSPDLFKRDSSGPVGLLRDGGTAVVKIAG